MQQQALASIEKSEPKKVVVGESQQGASDNVGETESAVTFGECHLSAHRRIAVHVVNVAAKRWVGVMDQGVGQSSGEDPLF